MNEKENERHYAYGHGGIETIDEKHNCAANESSEECSLPVEEMK